MKLALDGDVIGIKVEFATLEVNTAEYDDETNVLVVDRDRLEKDAKLMNESVEERLSYLVCRMIALPYEIVIDEEWTEKTKSWVKK